MAGLASCDLADGDTAAATARLHQARKIYTQAGGQESSVAADLAALEPQLAGG